MSVWGSNNISADDISADDTELAQKAENRQAVVKSFSYSAANFGAITSARLPKILSVENPDLPYDLLFERGDGCNIGGVLILFACFCYQFSVTVMNSSSYWERG